MSILSFKKKRKYGMNLTEGPIFINLIIFAIPIILTSFLQQLYITLGSVIVGKFAGETSLAAIGATTSLTNVLLYLFIGLSVGATVTCAKCYGSGEIKALDKAIHTSVMLALCSGVFLAIVGGVFSRPLLSLMGTPDSVIGPASSYMTVYFLGSPASMMYNFGSGILRAGGDTKRPLFILSVSGVVNIAVSLICVVGLKMNVVGAAIGTVFSQIFSAVLVFFILVRSNNFFKVRIKDIRFHKEALLNILKVGVPSGISSMLFSFANLFLQSSINMFDKAYIAGSSAGTSVENFIFLVMNAIEQGVVSYVGQNLGAGKYKRIDRVVLLAHLMGTVTTVLMAVFVLLNTESLLALFNDGTDVIKAGKIRLDIVCKTCLLYLPTVLMSGALKGMERSSLPMIINILFIGFTRVLWMLFVFPIAPTFSMIFYCFPVSWALSSAAQITSYIIVRYKIEKNKKNTVDK